MVQKLRELFIYIPKPELHGVIQMDEMFFHESQKGIDNPADVLKVGKQRKGVLHQNMELWEMSLEPCYVLLMKRSRYRKACLYGTY